MTMSENKIRLSARAVLDLLSGTKTPEEFFAGFGNRGPFAGNQFDRQRELGRLITKIEFLPGEDDDDEIEFTFGSADPAVSPYCPPRASGAERS
jgi:hypothetical protein